MAEVILEGVYKRYGKLEAVKNLNLHIKDREFFCLLGPSGAGKTSTLRMIAGLEEISEGIIKIGNRIINNLEPKDRDVAMVFENYALYPHMTVYENLSYPLKGRGMTSSEIDKRVRYIAGLLQIAELLDRKPRQLSGGQKQRVALGRAIVRNPQVFLMDEPISHLDAKLRTLMRAELKRLQRELNTTTIYATPDQREAIAMADTIAIINKGEIQQIGTPLEIFNFPANEFVAGFTGEPPMNLFDCSVESKKGKIFIRIENFELSLPDEIASKLKEKSCSRELKAGIRPTDIQISQSLEEKEKIPAQIYVIEPLGKHSIVTAKVNNTLFKIKVAGSLKIPEGENIWLKFNTHKLHFFDKKTGLNVMRG